MSDDVSVFMRVSIVVIFTAALVATVIQIFIPLGKWVIDQGEKYINVSNINYDQIKYFRNKRFNAMRIYRYA